MFLFGINALRGISPRRWLKQRWWLLGLVWVGLYALSYFWSTDSGEWSNHVQVKLPFLLLPLAFPFLDPWTPGQLRAFTTIFITIMLAGAGYSISFMLGDPAAYINGYKFSHTLPTPHYIDHISFSTIIALCIAWCAYSWRFWAGTFSRILLALAMALLIIYLHILAAKTGLIALYIFLLCCLAYLLVCHWKKGLLLLVIIICGGLAASKFIPTLRERINYSFYSYSLYREGERNGLYSDMGRMISYHLAMNIIREEPLAGAGAGDVLHEMNEQYRRHYPHIPEEQHLYPHNQFLTVAVAAGIPAVIAFVWWLLAPLVRICRNREGFFFMVIWLMLLVPLMVDPFLEVQAGVFVFLFFLLMQRSLMIKGVADEKINPEILI